MKRCPHGVMLVGDEEKSPYCTICTVPAPLTEEEKKLQLHPVSPYPYGERKCPICDSPKFKYVNDYNFRCRDCGFDALT